MQCQRERFKSGKTKAKRCTHTFTHLDVYARVLYISESGDCVTERAVHMDINVYMYTTFMYTLCAQNRPNNNDDDDDDVDAERMNRLIDYSNN